MSENKDTKKEQEPKDKKPLILKRVLLIRNALLTI